MIGDPHSRQTGRANYSWRIFVIAMSGAAVAGVAWLAVPDRPMWSQAVAAEVDAIGVPAPLGFADIVAKVKPAVVGLRVRVEEASSSSEAQQKRRIPPDTLLDRLFRQFGTAILDSPAPRSGIALGSGFFVSGDGYIVTNNHLVTNGKSFQVAIDGGQTYEAKVVGTDPQTDLALIKINAATDFPYVRLAAEVPRAGDWVLVVGNPFGLGGSVTSGIVSARGRDIGAGPYDDFIQIDAPVNLGNSGGPTFNVKGEVIGVNTAIYSPSGGSIGVAFDIPAETVKLVVRQLRDKGHVTRGWIGVQIQPVTPTIAALLGLKTAEGALVAQLEPNSPAMRNGIEVGDVIASINGEAVKDSRDLAKRIATIAPKTPAKFGIIRNGQAKTITVTLGELPRISAEAKAEEKRARGEASALGLSLAPASAVPGAGDHGVVITEISPASPAAESGLESGDIILEVGRRAVNSPADVRKMVEEARTQKKSAVLLRVKRDDRVSFVAVPIA